MQAAEDCPPKRTRGRPRKARPDANQSTVEVIVQAAPAPAVPPREQEEHLSPARDLRKLAVKPEPLLAPGERWKRRLGRWSR